MAIGDFYFAPMTDDVSPQASPRLSNTKSLFDGMSEDSDDARFSYRSTEDPSTYRSSDDWDDGKACSVCKVLLGKRRLQRRHHCRVCHRAVCGPCSPGVIPITGLSGTHRVCKECAEDCGKGPALKKHLRQLVDRLGSISGEDLTTVAGSEFGAFEEGVRHSDTVAIRIRELESEIAVEGIARQRLEAELALAQNKVSQICSLLQGVRHDRTSVSGSTESGLLEALGRLAEITAATAAASKQTLQNSEGSGPGTST